MGRAMVQNEIPDIGSGAYCGSIEGVEQSAPNRTDKNSKL